jgi:hypothetical protein
MLCIPEMPYFRATYYYSSSPRFLQIKASMTLMPALQIPTSDQGTKSATIAVLDSEAHPTGKKRFGIVMGGWNLVTGCCVSFVDGNIDEGELRISYGNEEEKMEYRINYRYIDVFLHRKGLDKMGFSFVYIEREWAKHQRLFP